MKNSLWLFAGALALAPVAGASAHDAEASAERMKADVTLLASDELEGRDTGTDGYNLAAGYVAGQFAAIRLEPVNGPSYFQHIPFRFFQVDGVENVSMSLFDEDGEEVAIPSEQIMINTEAPARAAMIQAPLVFLGNGFSDEASGWDDFSEVDVEGKIAVVLRSTPKVIDDELRAVASENQHVRLAERGALGMIVLVTPTYEENYITFDVLKSQIEQMTNLTWVGPDGAAAGDVPENFVRAFANEELGRRLLEGQPLSWDEAAAADADGTTPLATFDMDMTARLMATNEVWEMTSPNVLGVLPGSDPELAHEVVVVTAHLDHIGIQRTDEEGDDEIFNGAMDNATGVAIITEVARLLKETPPRRTLVFAALTAEEKGLMGSDYLARYPVLADTHKVVANVNVDMPVPIWPFVDLVAFGSEHSTMGPVVAEAVAAAGLTLIPDPFPEENFFTRSDHYRFVQQGIPAVYLDTGTGNGGEELQREFLANHYHQPSDEAELIDFEQLARFSDVFRNVLVGVANMDEAPRWKKDNFYGKVYGGPMEE